VRPYIVLSSQRALLSGRSLAVKTGYTLSLILEDASTNRRGGGKLWVEGRDGRKKEVTWEDGREADRTGKEEAYTLG